MTSKYDMTNTVYCYIYKNGSNSKILSEYQAVQRQIESEFNLENFSNRFEFEWNYKNKISAWAYIDRFEGGAEEIVETLFKVCGKYYPYEVAFITSDKILNTYYRYSKNELKPVRKKFKYVVLIKRVVFFPYEDYSPPIDFFVHEALVRYDLKYSLNKEYFPWTTDEKKEF